MRQGWLSLSRRKSNNSILPPSTILQHVIPNEQAEGMSSSVRRNLVDAIFRNANSHTVQSYRISPVGRNDKWFNYICIYHRKIPLGEGNSEHWIKYKY